MSWSTLRYILNSNIFPPFYWWTQQGLGPGARGAFPHHIPSPVNFHARKVPKYGKLWICYAMDHHLSKKKTVQSINPLPVKHCKNLKIREESHNSLNPLTRMAVLTLTSWSPSPLLTLHHTTQADKNDAKCDFLFPTNVSSKHALIVSALNEVFMVMREIITLCIHVCICSSSWDTFSLLNYT